jgi:hypothetical protein
MATAVHEKESILPETLILNSEVDLSGFSAPFVLCNRKSGQLEITNFYLK